MPSSSLSLLQLCGRAELFPMLTLCSCMSHGEESKNGPRYSAQDKFTGCMYEVRCIPLNVSEAGTDIDNLLDRQKRRLDALIAASQRRDLPPCVSLPIDGYVHELASSKEYFVVSVSLFAGLSLGDMIRSGCRLLEDADFGDILSCVEKYGLECMRLPPHGNLGLHALLRLLNVRPGAVEANNSSRWVIGDWLLLGENTAPTSHEEVIGDLEWLLYSTFSKLNVVCDPNGNVLEKDVVEVRINETIDRIRRGTIRSVGRSPKVTNSDAHMQRNNNLNKTVLINDSPSSGNGGGGGDSSASLLDRVALHRQKLQHEQLILQSYQKQKEKGGRNRHVRFTNEGELDDSDTQQRRVKIMEVIYPSKILRSIALETEESRQQFVGRKEAILDAIREVLNMASERDARNRKTEEVARRAQREALLSMLIRSVTTSSKRAKSPYVDSGCASQRNQSLMQPASIISSCKPSRSLEPAARGIRLETFDDEKTGRMSSPPAWQCDLQQQQEQEHPVVSAPSIRVSANGSILTSRHEVNNASEEQPLQNTSSTMKIGTLSNRQKNIIGNQTNTNSAGRVDQQITSPRTSFQFGVTTTEKSPLVGNLFQAKRPQTTRRRLQAETGNKRTVRSAPRRTMRTHSTPHAAAGSKVSSGVNPSPAGFVSRHQTEAHGRSEGSSRLPRRHSKIFLAGGSNGVSRGQVYPANETSLGITMRRRHAGNRDDTM